MSKMMLATAGLLLAAMGYALGHSTATTGPPPAPKGPPPALSEAQMAEVQARFGELKGLLREPNSFVRLQQLATRLSTLDEGAVPAVAGLLRQGTLGLGPPETDLLVRFWASYDPEATTEWVWGGVHETVRNGAIDAAIETAATADPKTAWTLLEKRLAASKYDVDYGREALARGWVLSGQPGVVDLLLYLAHGVERQRCMSEIVRMLMLRDGPAAAAQWLVDLEDDGHMLKEAAYNRAAYEFARYDRDFALEWCEKHCEEPKRSHLRAIIALTWAKRDGPAAMRWLSTAPMGNSRTLAVWMTFRSWRAQDPDGLMAFIDEMGPGGVEPWFVPAVDRIAMWKSWENPLEAYEWASHMEDEERREITFISITRRWREKDEAAAEAWLEQSPLSEAARAKARDNSMLIGPDVKPSPVQEFVPDKF